MRRLLEHWTTQFLCVTLSLIMTIGCGTTSSFTPGVGKKYVYSYTMVSPVPDQGLLFQDERIAVAFTIDEAAIQFRLQNRTEKLMWIEWDRVVIGVEDRFERVRHAIDLYSDSLNTQAFPLPARGFIRDLVLPQGNIRDDGIQWSETPLFQTVDGGDEDMRAQILGNVGRRIRLTLPVRIASGIVPYEFVFEISSAEEVPWNEYSRTTREPRPPAREHNLTKQEQTVTIAIVVGFLAMFALLISTDKSPPSE